PVLAEPQGPPAPASRCQMADLRSTGGGITLAEGCVCGKNPLLFYHRSPFLIEESGHSMAQTGMADPVHRAGGRWFVAARQLVLALCAGLDGPEAMREGVV